MTVQELRELAERTMIEESTFLDEIPFKARVLYSTNASRLARAVLAALENPQTPRWIVYRMAKAAGEDK